MEDKICRRCNKLIKNYDKAVLLKTFVDKKTLEELYFHFQCWVDDLREKDEKRALGLYNKSMKEASLMLRKMFNNVQEETNTSPIFEIRSS